MKKTLFILVFLFLVASNSNILFGEDIHYLSKEELFVIYSTKLKSLNLPTLNLSNVKPDDFLIVNDIASNGRKVATVGCKNCGFGMEIDAVNGKILFCINHVILENNKNLDKGDSKPKKTKEEIIKQAEEYVKILIGEMPKDTGSVTANYINPTCKVEWHVFWDRREGEYKYCSDSFGVTIDEDYGLSSFGYNFFSDYIPPKQIDISKEKAIEIGKKNINKIMHSPNADGRFNSYKTGEVKSAKLWIVNPNYFHIKGEYSFTNKPYARLAWAVDFACVNKKTDKEDGFKKVSIWIDAETGEILGGG